MADWDIILRNRKVGFAFDVINAILFANICLYLSDYNKANITTLTTEDIIFTTIFAIIGLLFGEDVFKSFNSPRHDCCPADISNDILSKYLEKRIKNLDEDVLVWLRTMNRKYIEKLLENHLDKDSLEDLLKSGSNGIIISKSADLVDFKDFTGQFIKRAKSSYYATGIYPPSFWISGSLWFNWDKINPDKPEDKSLIIDHLKLMCNFPFPFNTPYEKIDVNKDKDNNTMTGRYSELPLFSIIYNEKSAKIHSNFLKGYEGGERCIANLYTKSGNIYKGECNDLNYFRKYFEDIRDLGENGNLKITKRRVLITDIYSNQKSWVLGEEPHAIKKYLDYNKGTDIKICSILSRTVKDRYFGDLVIIDRSVALIFAPNKVDYSGEKSGRIKIVYGDLVNKYLRLFEDAAMTDPSLNVVMTPEQFWGDKVNFEVK
ncbi:MAG TPA: hypothetical protein PLX30_03800 [Methanothrix sp.]|nr:hypothetical protein [Methanothrix sp.]